MMTSAPVLKVRNLAVKKGGNIVLEISELDIHHGDALAILGPNGSGKTTLINALSLLEKPVRGEIFFKGEKVPFNGKLHSLRRCMGVVFQRPMLFNTTVYKNIAAGLHFRGVNSREIKQKVIQILDELKISHLMNRSARKLSGGEASRVSLARALILNPEILFLDEPFTSLDPPTQEQLQNDFEKILSRHHRITTVFVTHNCSEAMRLARRIAVMDQGRFLQIGTVEEVVNFPMNEIVAQFTGTETIIPAKIKKSGQGSFLAATGTCEIEGVGDFSVGDDVILGIRPENVILSTGLPEKEKISARNLFPGRVTRIIKMGHFFKVFLDCGFPLTSYVTLQSVENLKLEKAKEITAQFKATAIHVISIKHS